MRARGIWLWQRLVWTDREKRVTYEGEGRGVLRVKRENDEKCVGVCMQYVFGQK